MPTTSRAASRSHPPRLPAPLPDHRPARLQAARIDFTTRMLRALGGQSSLQNRRPCRMPRQARMLQGVPHHMDRVRLRLSRERPPIAIDSCSTIVGTTLFAFRYSPDHRHHPMLPRTDLMLTVLHRLPNLLETTSPHHLHHLPHTPTPLYPPTSLFRQRQRTRQPHPGYSRTPTHVGQKIVPRALMLSRCSLRSYTERSAT